MASRFEARKQKILEQLDAPGEEYHDLSPKGSVDEPIRDLLREINDLDGLVTTSSCSGRISVFLEGRKAESEVADAEESRAGPGGKGGGGSWLFISHSPVDISNTVIDLDCMSLFGLEKAAYKVNTLPSVSCRYIHLKFEPMILHILTASLDHAQRVLTAALAAGFRESGAVSLTPTKTGELNPMVAVRSTGYSFDSIIGFHDDNGRNVPLGDESFLLTLVQIANDRFRINMERIARFRTALMESYQTTSSTVAASLKPDWEDAEARKQRKRIEGLARQQALQTQNTSNGEAVSKAADVDAIEDMFR